jgi:magnesium-transporting ATPase (P-type)
MAGDNANTACYIARESGMIDASEADSRHGDSQIIIADVNDKDSVEWRMVMVDHSSSQDERIVGLVDLHQLLQTSHDGGPQVELAVTGKAFNRLMESGEMRRYLLGIHYTLA